MSADINEDLLLAAERAMAEDIAREHGCVGAARVALALLRTVVSRVTPTVAREAWTFALLRPAEGFVQTLEGAAARASGNAKGPQRFDA